jgi:hypothetical protein
LTKSEKNARFKPLFAQCFKHLTQLKGTFYNLRKEIIVKNITLRNIFGASLGGSLGIFAFAYFDWKGLPLGCFFGVVLGFWHREMWKLLSRSFRIQTRKQKPSVAPTVEKRMIRVQRVVDAIWYLICFCAIVYFGSKIKPHMGIGSRILTICETLYCAVGFLVPALFQKSHRAFLNDTEIYQSLGAFRYSLKLFANYLYFFVGGLIALCIFGLGLGTIGLFTAFIPWLFLQSCRIFWHMAMKAGHWPCFTVTTATTATVAFLYHPSPNQQAMLWAVALLAGFASGALTFALQHVISRLPRFSNQEIRLTIEEIDTCIDMRGTDWDNRKSDFYEWMDHLSRPFPAHL